MTAMGPDEESDEPGLMSPAMTTTMAASITNDPTARMLANPIAYQRALRKGFLSTRPSITEHMLNNNHGPAAW